MVGKIFLENYAQPLLTVQVNIPSGNNKIFSLGRDISYLSPYMQTFHQQIMNRITQIRICNVEINFENHISRTIALIPNKYLRFIYMIFQFGKPLENRVLFRNDLEIRVLYR